MGESEVTRAIMHWIRSLKGAKVCKLHMSQYGTNGEPDLYGCLNGRMFVLEVKYGLNDTSKIQDIRLREWKDAGAVVGVAWSLEDAKRILKELMV